MATAAVLQPLDINRKLGQSFKFTPSQCVQRSAPESSRTPVCSSKSNRRRRSPLDEKSNKDIVRKFVKDVSVSKELVMEKVRILKRGENFNPNLCPELSPNLVKSQASDVLRKRFDGCMKKEVGVVVADRKQFDGYRKKGPVVEGRFAGFEYTSPHPSKVPVPKMLLLRKEEENVESCDVSVARRCLG